MTDFVVCIIEATWRNVFSRPHPNPPRKGKVYTSLGLVIRKNGKPVLRLAEYPGQTFNPRCFRPLDNKRLDIFRSVPRGLEDLDRQLKEMFK